MACSCVPRIEQAGFPHRSEVILARERRLYPGMVMILLGHAKAEPRNAEERLTVELIEEGFASSKGRMLGAAAFLAGRCEPVVEAGAAATLMEHCRRQLNARAVGDLGSHDWGYVEAAMALALRGEPETARSALQAIVDGGGAGTTHDFLAAFYLAQLGDPEGWPVLRAALTSDDPVARVDAARHVVGFAGYDATTVPSEVIDVRAALSGLLDDESTEIAEEIPGLLDELGMALANRG